ncbi:protein S40-4-like [Primulina huaijiensis]|uniref:protein S40-4-like n=1 Tax=Primulina huaijiensis TaxID=1492673 RepID=UPI003CC6FCCD
MNMEMKNNLYGLYSPGSSGWTSLRNPEFQEADIWEVFQDAEAPEFDQDSSSISKRLTITPTRTIPKPNKTSSHSKGQEISQQSAPVDIPDWSKIYRSSSMNSIRDSHSWLSTDSDFDNVNHQSWETSKDDCEEEEEDENHMIPPHEWIARKVSRSEIFSFSVCEGAGRTLKGRDLSRVRNAILIKTGFLESNSSGDRGSQLARSFELKVMLFMATLTDLL